MNNGLKAAARATTPNQEWPDALSEFVGPIHFSTGGRAFDADAPVLFYSRQRPEPSDMVAAIGCQSRLVRAGADLPGHYISGGDVPATIEDAADWCIDLLDAAGVRTAIFIGHSQGGLIALEVARRHPDRVERSRSLPRHWRYLSMKR